MLNQNRNISPNFNKDFSPLKMNIEINGKNHLLKDLDNKNNNISLNLTKPSTEQISNQLNENLPEVKISNIISMANVGCKLKLRNILNIFEKSKYIPGKEYIIAEMVIKGEKTMALIFKTGKIVCSGSKTEECSKNAIKKYAKIIKQFRYKEAKLKILKLLILSGFMTLNSKLIYLN